MFILFLQHDIVCICGLVSIMAIKFVTLNLLISFPSSVFRSALPKFPGVVILSLFCCVIPIVPPPPSLGGDTDRQNYYTGLGSVVCRVSPSTGGGGGVDPGPRHTKMLFAWH